MEVNLHIIDVPSTYPILSTHIMKAPFCILYFKNCSHWVHLKKYMYDHKLWIQCSKVFSSVNYQIKLPNYLILSISMFRILGNFTSNFILYIWKTISKKCKCSYNKLKNYFSFEIIYILWSSDTRISA